MGGEEERRKGRCFASRSCLWLISMVTEEGKRETRDAAAGFGIAKEPGVLD